MLSRRFPGLPFLAVLLALSLPGIAAAQAVDGKTLVNVDKKGLALQGYDPVALYTGSKSAKGSDKITSTFNGGTYYFASAENKATFDANPAKYEPQFGGFCAYGVSKGHTVKVEIETAQVVDGRLLLNYDLSVKKKFDADRAGNLKKADEQWPQLVAKDGKAAAM